jgi:hypothetical protein
VIRHEAEAALILPIRTRGGLRLRDEATGEVGRCPARVRGALRIRGAVASADEQTPESVRSFPLAALLQELRKEVGDLPLTVIVHGFGSPPAVAFLEAVAPLLHCQDALWLVPFQGASVTTPAPAGREGAGVLLDLGRDTEQRTYRNLIGDLVFYPGLAPEEAAEVAGWKQRARTLVVDGRAPAARVVLEAGGEALLPSYRWSGAAVAVEE